MISPGDLEEAFAVANYTNEIDVALEQEVENLAQQNLSTTCELVEATKAINSLRQSRGIEFLHYSNHHRVVPWTVVDDMIGIWTSTSSRAQMKMCKRNASKARDASTIGRAP